LLLKDFRKNGTTQDRWTTVLEEEAHYIGNNVDYVLSVAPEFGQFLYTYSAFRAKWVVEFGYFLWCLDDHLACTLSDSGGSLIGTELDP